MSAVIFLAYVEEELNFISSGRQARKNGETLQVVFDVELKYTVQN